MRSIKKYVEHIEEELEGAKDYAEKYVEAKAAGNTMWAGQFKDMAQDELRHAGVVHSHAVEEIEKLNKVYKPPVEMLEKWEHAHKEYVEKAAWIKQMLSM
jgi:hypothetical protein